MRASHIFILFSLFLFSGCRPEFTRTRNNIPRPEEFKLHGQTDSLSPRSFLDTNAVYINESVWEYFSNENEPVENLIYWPIRFSNNGIGVRGPAQESFPTDSQLNNLSSGTFFYYILDGNNLKIEWYDTLLKEFVYWYGTVDEKKVQFHKQKIRTLGGGTRKFDTEHYTYYRHPFIFDAPLQWPE